MHRYGAGRVCAHNFMGVAVNFNSRLEGGREGGSPRASFPLVLEDLSGHSSGAHTQQLPPPRRRHRRRRDLEKPEIRRCSGRPSSFSREGENEIEIKTSSQRK